MSRVSAFVLCVLAALAGPAGAQGYGQQPYGQGAPQPYGQGAPQPYGQGGGQGGGGAPSFGYGQPQQQGSGMPSLVGTWSGQVANSDGPTQQADYFGPDGQFTTVARFANGFIARAWGSYRASPAGPNQLRVELQLQGTLPREVCRQAPGFQPECQPFQVPPQDTVLVTFTSPGSLQSVSQTVPGPPLYEQRDPQPALLGVQAPQRWVLNVSPPQQAPVATQPAPVVITPYQSPIRRGPATNIPGLGGNCDDLQQRRICMDGSLVRGRDGCLVCLR